MVEDKPAVGEVHDTVLERNEVTFLEMLAMVLRHIRLTLILGVVLGLLVMAWVVISPRDWTSHVSFYPHTAADIGTSRLSSLAGQFGVQIPGAEAAQSPEFYAELAVSREILYPVASTEYVVADTSGLFPSGLIDGDLAALLELDLPTQQLQNAAAVKWLRNEALEIRVQRETSLVDIHVTTRWPDLSAQIAEKILQGINGFNLSTRQSQAAAERRFIEERLVGAEAELREAENALKLFLQNNRSFQNSPELVFEHDRLNRRVATRQEVYNSLVQSFEQARISEVRNTPVVTVVDGPAEPALPDRRRLLLKVLLGFLGGAGLGALIALTNEWVKLRRRMGDPVLDEVIGRVGRPFRKGRAPSTIA